MVEHFPSIHQALGSIPSAGKICIYIFNVTFGIHEIEDLGNWLYFISCHLLYGSSERNTGLRAMSFFSSKPLGRSGLWKNIFLGLTQISKATSEQLVLLILSIIIPQIS